MRAGRSASKFFVSGMKTNQSISSSGFYYLDNISGFLTWKRTPTQCVGVRFSLFIPPSSLLPSVFSSHTEILYIFPPPSFSHSLHSTFPSPLILLPDQLGGKNHFISPAVRQGLLLCCRRLLATAAEAVIGCLFCVWDWEQLLIDSADRRVARSLLPRRCAGASLCVTGRGV